jgi:hypothetical protein
LRPTLSLLLLLAAVAHAAPGPLTGPSARAVATPTVRTLGAGVVVDGVADGVILGHRGAEPLGWTWRGSTFINVAPPSAPPAAPAAPTVPPSCGDGVPSVLLPSSAPGWAAGLCPDGRVALRREQGGHGAEAVVTALDGAPVVAARALDPGEGAFGLLVWGEGGATRAVAWRAQELVPAGWSAAFMPAGPALDWPVPADVNPRLEPAVKLDLTLPQGAVVTDAFVREGRLTLVGTLPQGRSTQAAVFDTPWIPVLPR